MENITIHRDFTQGSPEWLQARTGLLTASEVKHILTPTLKVANNDKTRCHLYEIAGQRITGYTEPSFVSDDMLRGQQDEFEARAIYNDEIAPVEEVAFITRDFGGFTLGYSPDGLIGEDGLIEVKSRRQKYQIETIVKDEVPDEYMLQLQTGLLVSGRKWLDFISFSAGLPMFVKRVLPDSEVQAAIIEAATAFEGSVALTITRFKTNSIDFIQTERRDDMEIVI